MPAGTATATQPGSPLAPGKGALNAGGNAQVLSVPCPAAGNCAAGGYYHDSSHHLQGFVVSQG